MVGVVVVSALFSSAIFEALPAALINGVKTVLLLLAVFLRDCLLVSLWMYSFLLHNVIRWIGLIKLDQTLRLYKVLVSEQVGS